MDSKQPSTRPKSRKGGNKKKAIAKYSLGSVPDGTLWNNYSGSYPQPRIPKGLPSMISVVKSVDLGIVLTTSATIVTAASLNFTLSQIPEYASFTTLFDQYKIDEVEVFLVNEGNTDNNALDSRIATVLDYDDSTNLTSVAQALDYDNVRVSAFNSGHYRKLKPRIAVAAYSGSFASYANQSSWIDCASTGVQHYGVKLVAEASVSAANIIGLMRMRVSFRQPR
jgi:hypothetical protein